ncbi:histone-lysine N-methyltransferase SETMAR-like [Vespa crabro]|uniref:histone-lysine N-methyltransferase SETMAR-like n=1 Tax=Vespa crabro TaxID=7445 RepID=UPI001F0165D6|nr:histone-lysine N-methyltransferase SETMAR-like [Vespa crabro]
MSSQIPEEHIRHCMLVEFRKDSNATVTTKNICDVYPRRPITLDNDMLRTEVEANPCQAIEELSNIFNQPWSTIQEYLQQIGKISRAGLFGSPIICPMRTKPIDPSHWLSPNESPRSTAKPGLHPKKALVCVWWSIRGIVHFEVLKPGQTVNADLYREQLDRVNQSLIEEYSVIVNRKGVILQHDNARPHCTRRTLEKINELGWEVLPHSPYSPDIAPSDFHLFRSLQHFLSGKKFENFMVSKMPSRDILLKNQLIFIGPTLLLKICTLDGKRLLTTKFYLSTKLYTHPETIVDVVYTHR